MNDYSTPRRRHSSLFQRMEEQISKISRKLSAAKQHKTNHTNNNQHLQRNQSPGLTVRRAKQPLGETTSKELTRKYNCLADRTNQQEPKGKQPIRRIKFSHAQLQDLQDFQSYDNSQANRLAQENRLLTAQLKHMKAICQQQSFKLGYLQAQNNQVIQQLQSARLDSYREQVYLNKLVQGYKIKVGKYKRILEDDESLSIDIIDL